MRQRNYNTLCTALAAFSVLARPALAEVPAEQALGLYARSNPDHLELSPIWGMVALKSGILANIRFFGWYGSREQAGLPRHPQLEARNNCPLDAVAGVVEYLFPSPDGFNLVHNEYRKDPIGQIAREAKEGKSPHGGLKKILVLLNAITHYRATIRGNGAGAALDAASLDFRGAAYRILDRAKGSADGEGPDTAFNQLRTGFAALLQQAVLEETTATVQKYPPNIVEVALLAYAWRVADQVAELDRAFDGFLLAKAEEGKGGHPSFNQAYYQAHLPGFLKAIEASAQGGDGKGEPAPGSAAPPSPEEIALFLQGYAAFEARVPNPVAYKTTTYGKEPYPDCGETSLRNFLNIVFARAGAIDQDRVRQFVAACEAAARREDKNEPVPGMTEGKAGADRPVLAHPGALKALAAYYARFHGLSQHHSAPAHHAWSQIVSNLNTKDDPIPIRYRQRSCNLMGIGIGNMLDLVGHLLPDPLLQAPWPEDPADPDRLTLAGEKLTRLCVLVSSTGNTIGWSVGGTQALDSELVDVDFSINGVPSFQWQFRDGHFAVLVASALSRQAWPARIPGRPRDPWLACWLRSYQPTTEFQDRIRPWDVKQPYEVFSFRLQDPEAVLRVLMTIGAPEFALMKPTFQLLVARTLPFDANAIVKVLAVLDKYPALREDKAFYPLPAYLAQPEAARTAMLVRCLRDPRQHLGDVAMFMLEHGADARFRDDQGDTLLSCAMLDHHRKEGLIQRLIQGGADLNARNIYGDPPVVQAVGDYGTPTIFKALLEAGADPEATGLDGRTVRSLIARRSDPTAFLAILDQVLKERADAARQQEDAKASPATPAAQ